MARYTKMACLAGAAMVVLAAQPAAAQALEDRYWIEVSAYFPEANTEISVSRPGAPGTVVDLESDLGVDDAQTLPAFYAGARLGKRWIIAGEYYGLDRDGSRSITREIDFDGVTFPVGVEVRSQMRSDVYRVSLGYAFIQNDRAELGAALGLHATSFETRLSGSAQIGGGALHAEDRRTEFTAPLPTIGVFGTYEITPRIILTGRADYLSLTIDDYDGSIVNAQAAVAYKVNDMIEVGAAWRYVDYELDVAKDNYTAGVEYDFSGPSLFVRFGFQ